MKEDTTQINEFHQRLITWRRALHQIPEIGMQLTNTCAYIKEQLDDMCIAYKELAHGAGIVVEIGQGEGLVLLRSDMDALSISEESEESFSSVNGNMHACGHDMHTTILLGSIYQLKQEEKHLKGRVRFLFQSGEESLEGAKEACKQGVLQDVQAAFAMHVMPTLPVGYISYGLYPMSASIIFSIHIKGKGGHSSAPQDCIDPIVSGIQIHQAFQSLINKECSPKDEVVLSIGSIQAGNVANVIPDTCILKGTLRTYSDKQMEVLFERMKEIVDAIACMQHVDIHLNVESRTSAVCCDETLMRLCVRKQQEVFPTLSFHENFHIMGSEDFSYISNVVPSVYMALGASVEQGEIYSLHHPKARFHEDCLYVGVNMYVHAAYTMLSYVKDKKSEGK